MFNILTLNKIAAVGTDRLDTALFSCADKQASPHAVLVRSADMHEFPLDGNLLAIARAGAGVNNIPVEKCSEAGVVVFNTPGANANAVKELVLCALFLASRDVVGGVTWAQGLKNEGDNVPALVEKGKSAFAGPEIQGKTLGVVGLGAIGAMVANAACALGMNVLGFDPYLSIDAAWGLSNAVRKARDLRQIYMDSDYITLHIPLTPETRGSVNAEVFSMARSGLRIINMARGELVNTADIKAALEAGTVAAYVTDFPNADLLGVKNIVPVPHLGASTPESEDNCAVMAVDQMADFLRFGTVKNSVNLPDVSLEIGSGGSRLCVIHRNVPNMVGSISSALAAKKVNIENMVNKSKKDMAYSIFDLGSIPEADCMAGIEKMEGVLRARLIV